MPSAFLAVIALAGVPTTGAVSTDFVAYRVEYRTGDESTSGDPEYVVHTPHNSVVRPLHGGLAVFCLEGATLKVRLVPWGAPSDTPMIDEFQFVRGRVRLVREHPHPER